MLILCAMLLVFSPYAAVAQGASRQGAFHVEQSGALRAILIAGLDRDPQSASAERRSENHTDSLILLLTRIGSGHVQALHIPRDTRVFTKQWGVQKMNGIWRLGGASALSEAVYNLTQIRPCTVLTLDFSSFRKVLQAVPRLPFYVDRTITSPEGDVVLAKGLHQLSPRQALAVVRFRHEPLGDIGRVHRQERFLREAVKMATTLSYPVFGHLLTLLEPGLPESQAQQLYTVVHGMTVYSAHSVPGTFSTTPGASYWVPDHAGVAALTALLVGRPEGEAVLQAWSRQQGARDADDGRDHSL